MIKITIATANAVKWKSYFLNNLHATAKKTELKKDKNKKERFQKKKKPITLAVSKFQRESHTHTMILCSFVVLLELVPHLKVQKKKPIIDTTQKDSNVVQPFFFFLPIISVRRHSDSSSPCNTQLSLFCFT